MSSLKDLYTEIRTELEDITGIKYVRLWNNQFERENVNRAFQFPCCLIEFEPTEGRDLLNGVQQYDFVVCIHLGFESYKTEDIDILDLKQQVFIKLGNFLSTTNMFSYLSRESETQNFDHDNIQDYQIRFKVTGKDFDGDTRPNTPVTVTVLTTNITLD